MNTEFLIEQAAPGQERLVMKRGESKVLLCQHGGGMKDCLAAAHQRAEAAENERRRARKSPPPTADSGIPEVPVPMWLRQKMHVLDVVA